jgi:transcription antitermination factor NusG
MDIRPRGVLLSGLPDARGLVSSLAPCASYPGFTALISSKTVFALARGPPRVLGVAAIYLEFGHGGARPNSGGARENAGGARFGAGRPPRHSNTGLLVSRGLTWHCVRTDHGGHLTADIEVRLAGFEVLNPSVWRAAEVMRRDRNGVVRPAKPDRIVQMFPRYFFTRFDLADPSWGVIEHLPGVDRLMGAAGGKGSPGIVSDEAIELLLLLLEPNFCAYPANHLHMNPIDPGTALRLLSGGMEGREGICEWSDGRRVRLLMHILGRPVTVNVSQGAVSTI